MKIETPVAPAPMSTQAAPSSCSSSIPWGGDYVVEVDGRGISNGNLLRQILALKQGGSTLRLKVIREGRGLEMEVKLRSQPQRL
jgi:S1-C subfamily serine protease